MIEDYQEKVLETYNKRKEDGLLSKNLLNPTVANLKKECLNIYDKRHSIEDNDILSTFFNVDKIEGDFRKTIIKVNSGAFRALSNHLKGSKSKTHERNSDLLAYLINFKPRPSFLFYKSINEAGEVMATSEVEQANPKSESEPPFKSIQNKAENENSSKIEINEPIISSKDSIKTRIILISILCLAALFIIAIWIYKIDQKTISNNEKCMLWNKDRFEAIECDNDASSKAIPLDLKRLKTLIRITEPDTLTKYSMGKVWYVKIDGKPEFYTASGLHPTHPDKRLNPISTYILNKYVSYYRYLFNLVLKLISITLLIIIIGLAYKHWWFKKSSLT